MPHSTAENDLTVLVFNTGSSSLTFKLYRHSEVLLRGKCHRVGVHGTQVQFVEVFRGEERLRQEVALSDHLAAARYVLEHMGRTGLPVDAVGHRFADGGGYFSRGVVVTPEMRPVLERCAPLAPLHNTAALGMIDLVHKRYPAARQYVVFDSTFHSGLPDVARFYALPYETALSYRKHGFHGLSYADVVEKASWYLGEQHFRAVALHLGTGGSSACAIVDGNSVDTSMGYSPLQGLVMNTRCGDLDPGIVVELVRNGATADDLTRILHRESGLYGLSGRLSSDIRDLAEVKGGNPEAKRAFDLYVYRVKQYIGSYAAVMNGLDVLIFTDDVGLRVPEVRAAVCGNLDALGIRLDLERNAAADPTRIEPLHLEGSPVRILAVPNDEERAIYAEGLLLLA
jgi:acetate kinase